MGVSVEELRLKERRMYSYIAGSLAFNALLSVALVLAVLGRPSQLVEPLTAHPQANAGTAAGAAADDGLSRRGRRLQCLGVPACGACPGDNWCMVNLPNLQSLLPFAQQWATQIIPSGGGITIMGNLRVMGGLEVVTGNMQLTNGGLTVSTGDVTLSNPAAKATVSSLEVGNMARIGTRFSANADSRAPVLYVYGDAWYGQAVTSGKTSYLTRVRPGKAVMSWPDKDGAGGEVRAESSLGRKTGDPATDPQLKVFGNSELGYKSASTADTVGKVVHVHGDVWVGQSTTGSLVHLTRVRPGKITTSWPKRDSTAGTEEASIGKRAAQSYTDFQLNVFGSVSLANGTLRLTV